jgi:pimeloyl-ACP methyl ester carboxylesterase
MVAKYNYLDGNFCCAPLVQHLMSAFAPFRSETSKESFLGWYERQLAQLPAPNEERDVVTIAGGRTHLVVAGPSSGEALFLVHGAGASAAHLRDEIAFYVGAGYRVYAPEMPGHMGKSEARKLSYGDATLGRWLDELFAAAGLRDALVIGYSLGGLAVLKLAEHAPARIRRGIAIVSAGLANPSLWRGRTVVVANLLHAITGSAKWRERMVRAMFAPGTTPIPFNLEFGMITVEHWQTEVRPMPLFEAAQLEHLTAPFLVLAAEYDPFFPPEEVLARARRVIPGVLAETIAGCGHMLDAEHIDGIRDRTLAFLRA